jgi:hypothetical protein
MKKLMTLGAVALIALTAGVSAKAEPQTQAALERRISWDTQHIRQLNHRRDVLHRYIRHMRAELHAPASTSTASSTSSTSTSSGSLTVTSSGWANELRAVGFPESAIPQMLYYIQRESGGDPNAVNGGGPAVAGGAACGLTQLYPCPGPGALDPMTNLRYAYLKYRASGFAPWGN